MADEQGDHEVGYGKPPRHSRFKPGQSGNPNGRPRKGESVMDLIERDLDRKMTVVESGKKKRIMRREAVARQFANRLIKGVAAGDFRTYLEFAERRQIDLDYREMLREQAADEQEQGPHEVTLKMGDPEVQYRVAKAALKEHYRQQGRKWTGDE